MSARLRYRSRHDVPLKIWISFAAPTTGSAEAVLPGSETVEIEAQPSGTDWLFARPQRYEALERALVPANYRESPAYGGYSLVVMAEQLDKDFDVIPGDPGEHPLTDILDHQRRVFSETVDDLVRQLVRLVPRYRLWGLVDWHRAPGNDDLEGLLRFQVNALTGRVGDNKGPTET